MTAKEVIEALKDLVYKGDNIQKICDYMILGAVLGGSSDIHIEPLNSFVRLRYRVDGELREVLEYQNFLHSGIVARLKILSDLKIDETRIPQDGRISQTIDGNPLDLRISTLPTVHGEKVVMRIVDKTKKIPTLDTLGIEGKNFRLIKEAIELPNGIILNSGPTGSGKTATLYSILTILNQVDVNIMTFEDPVEIQVDGINQSQVKPDIGYSFANGLRTALRQDPDIIMVGEIRDKETVDIAIEASLTGHLVLSTIHTNSAAETITRVLNMGVQPFLLPASFNIIIAQRLVRKLCPHCKKALSLNEIGNTTLANIKNSLSLTPKEELQERVGEKLKNPTFYGPVGCPQCDNLGYKGRMGIFEVLEITAGVKAMILQGQSAFNINKQAILDGMISLEQDGIMKALNGETSLEEVYSVARSQNG
ncbi:type II/IV secretion system protein [Candidatus Gracilibacteria bacterium]|nr:type II/IV secretion system protein [Candidatus Gracilibacteria bacterium]NUJ98682.1 type II/IV secretion system protein [Candidatus Gracilibacteria bacterium]